MKGDQQNIVLYYDSKNIGWSVYYHIGSVGFLRATSQCCGETAAGGSRGRARASRREQRDGIVASTGARLQRLGQPLIPYLRTPRVRILNTYIIYTPNSGLAIAIFNREREQGRFRGMSNAAVA